MAWLNSCGSPLYVAPAGEQVGILTDFRTEVNEKTAKKVFS
jgi:hypothetical protein